MLNFGAILKPVGTLQVPIHSVFCQNMGCNLDHRSNELVTSVNSINRAPVCALTMGARTMRGLIDSGASSSCPWSTHLAPAPLQRSFTIGKRQVTGLVDTGTVVNIVSPELAKDPNFLSASFQSKGHCTVSICGTPYTIHDPYRVMIEVPALRTAYMDTFYVSPVPMRHDMVLRPALPFKTEMSALVLPLKNPAYKVPIDYHSLFEIPHTH